MNFKNIKNKFLALLLASLSLVPITSPISQAVTKQAESKVERAITEQTETKAAQSVKNPQSKYGFSLKKTFSVDEHNIMEFQHEKSGMWLIVEKNNNIDKKFEIAVRTPPENDKGINHIIEHCVLNGSEEYPCKNMIWELHQMSYNTFLNAMTSACYTTFPVASIDEDELFSLAKIYTSGVFHPAFLKDERIFKKEGIRFELDSKNKLVPNGTVFNEMQGSNTDVLSHVLRTVFPDTQSKYISGGIPEKIMDLSYDEVCKTYKKYYHPSNMVAYMSGNINYERFMKFLDEEYLKNYDKINTNYVKYASQNTSKLPDSKEFNYYKQKTDKDIFSADIMILMDYAFFNKNIPDLNVLSNIINNDGSARTKFLKDKGYLGIEANVFDHFYDPAIELSLASEKQELVSPENTKKILKEMFEKYPITKDEITALLGNKDFNKKLDEKTNLYETPLDSSHFIKSFVKFGDPCSNVYFGSVSGKSNTADYNPSPEDINKIAKSAILESKKTIINFKPSDDKALSTKERLQAKINTLQSQKDKLTKNYKEQKAWAEAPNTEEMLAPIRKMFKKLSNIKTPEFDFRLENKKLNNVDCYQSTQEIGDFVAYKFAFNINNLTTEEIKYLDLLSYAISHNDTKNYTREKLNNLKSKVCQIAGSIDVRKDDKQHSNAYMIANLVLDKNEYDQAINLIREQVANVNFKDVSTMKKFLNLLSVSYDATPKPMLAFYDVMDSVYPTGNYTGGNQTIDEKISFYRGIESKLSDEKFVDALADKLSKLRDKIFNINALRSVALCSSKENEKLSQDKLADILKSLSKENYEQCKEIKLVSKDTKNMAFIDPSTSNNNIICMVNSKELCESPDFDVACRIITDKFLAPKIREKSGAYGARIYRMVGADKIVMNSYADPNVKSTIETFKSIPDFISNLEIKDIEIEDISKSILGQVFPVNKLGMFSLQSKNKMMSNIDYYKKLNSDISLIKTVTKERIKKQGELLREAMKNMKILVVSSDRKNLDEKMFDEIIE